MANQGESLYGPLYVCTESSENITSLERPGSASGSNGSSGNHCPMSKKERILSAYSPLSSKPGAAPDHMESSDALNNLTAQVESSAVISSCYDSSVDSHMTYSTMKAPLAPRDWKSSSEIPSSKVGIAHAQQRPSVQPPPAQPQFDFGYGSSSTGISTSSVPPQVTSVDLNSLLYNQAAAAVAGLTLHNQGANLQPSFSVPLAYWPMQVPANYAAAAQLQQALSLFRSNTLNSAAGYGNPVLQQHPSLPLSAFNAGASMPVTSIESLLSNQLRDEANSLLSTISTSLASNSGFGNSGLPAPQATVSSAPEMGKVYGYARRNDSDAPTTTSASSFGKVLAYTRGKSDSSDGSFASSSISGLNRDTGKFESAPPKINLPTRTLTIPTSCTSYASSGHLTESSQVTAVATAIPVSTVSAISPVSVHVNSSADASMHLPPKMRGKVTSTEASSMGSSHIAPSISHQDAHSVPVNNSETRHNAVGIASDASLLLPSPASRPRRGSARDISDKKSSRARQKDLPYATMADYLKCVNDVVVKYQRMHAEGRVDELMRLYQQSREVEDKHGDTAAHGTPSNELPLDLLTSTESLMSPLLLPMPTGSSHKSPCARRPLGSTASEESENKGRNSPTGDSDSDASSDSTICPESPPLVISYTKETLHEFCNRQYQSFLEDVEEPLKNVLSTEDENFAAKRKLIVLEQRVKRKLKMKFAGFDSEAKRAKLEATATAVAEGISSYSHMSRMPELSAMGTPKLEDGALLESPMREPAHPKSKGGQMRPRALSTSAQQVSPSNSKNWSKQVSPGVHTATPVCDGSRTVDLSPDDLVTGQRVLLRLKDNSFAAAKLVAFRPPDVYALLVDGERGSKPHVLTCDQVLQTVVLEVPPRSKSAVPPSSRVAAYSDIAPPRTLLPATVLSSSDSSMHTSPPPNTVKLKFDAGEVAHIGLDQIRLLSSRFKAGDYNLMTSAAGIFDISSASSTNRSNNFALKHKQHLWHVDSTSKMPRASFSENVVFSSIVKAGGVRISVNDYVCFHSCTDSASGKLPHVGQVISFFSPPPTSGDSSAVALVRVSWFYHPTELPQFKPISNIRNTLYKSIGEVEESDMQTISHKVVVLEMAEMAPYHFDHASAAIHLGLSPENLYVCAGRFDHVRGTLTPTPATCC